MSTFPLFPRAFNSRMNTQGGGLPRRKGRRWLPAFELLTTNLAAQHCGRLCPTACCGSLGLASASTAAHALLLEVTLAPVSRSLSACH